MAQLVWVFSAFVFISFNAHAGAKGPPFWQDFYIQRYGLPDDYLKLVDNTGDGFDPLYGTRNVREVLPGIMYRGGANNAYDKNGPRPNMNPLPNEGLVHLCQEGFSTAVYLYPDNYNTAPHTEDCLSVRGGNGHLDYLQYNGFTANGAAAVLQLVYQSITKLTAGPIYVHCWNGWHASGYVSAIALRQFCGISADAAVTYWNINTDGNDTGSTYDTIRAKIRAFVPDKNLNLPASVQAKVCPDLSYLGD